MKTKNRNQQLGYISSEEDRTIFQQREEFLKTFTLFEFYLFNDFELYFAGNMVNGFSYSKVLKSFLTDYQSMLQNKAMDLSHWFSNDLKNVYTATDIASVSPEGGPVMFNQLFSKDTRYQALIRTDGKLSPFFCMGKPNVKNGWGTWIPQGFPNSLKMLHDFSVSLKTAIPTNLNNEYGGTVTSISAPTTSYNCSFVTSFGNFYFTRDTSAVKHYILQIPNTTNSFVEFDFKNAVNATPASITNFKIVNSISPNALITMLNNVINIISFFEGENTALNVDGDYSGLASNNYEVILQQQLDYLNTINDAVSQSLINEKIDAQTQKDALIAKIAQKKIDIGKYIEVKKQAIKTLNTLVAQKAELARNV